MQRITAFLALTVVQNSMSAVAAPFIEERAGSVCSSDIYGELVPFLVPYSPAQAFCTAVFPVKCTTEAVVVSKRGAATTTKTSTAKKTTTKTTTTKTTTAKSSTSNNPTSSAWSKCQKQPLSVISTLCSCIASPKACPTTTTTTTAQPTTTTTTTTTEPTTTTTTTDEPTTTTTITTTTESTTTTTTPPAAPTPQCNGNTVTANGFTFCQFFAGYQVRNSFQYYTADFYEGGTADTVAIDRCANYVSSLGGVAQTFQVFYVPSEDQWHCDSSLQSNCDANFTPNDYVNQIYQYNVVGSTCST